MKIISRNVNWIRAIAKKWIGERIQKESPDILCLQEPKAFENQIPQEILDDLSWYNYVWHLWQRPWYAGTCIFYKKELKNVEFQNQFEIKDFYEEWRLTQISFLDTVVCNFYIPNWWTRSDWTQMLDYKLYFYEKIFDYLKVLKIKFKNIIFCGDFNICHKPIDIARPEANKNSIGFLPEERSKLDNLIKLWFVDAFRYTNWDIADKYTWRSYRAWAKINNVWRRIDYFFTYFQESKTIKNCYHQDFISRSDHCPIVLEI